MDNQEKKKQKLYIKTSKIGAKKGSKKWVIAIFCLTFLISVIIGFGSSVATGKMDVEFAVLVLIFIIAVGILFDMIGVAVTTAEETPFHALASKKVKSAETAVWLIRNAEKVSNFCNDVIGDVAGVVSGTTAAVIVAHLFQEGSDAEFYMGIVVTAVIASVTVGGKAIGKGISMRNSNQIVYLASKVICIFRTKKDRRG
ncbi:MAG: hypothetical protein E7399_01845 [Ruminococcaceae bacterium]|nr:hypothetical protein [Oscillospiraceae bacterium]